MPRLTYIGNYNPLADGKFLFEILCQLRNFGLGRIITKNEWMRKWPDQPSYCIIRKVEPGMDRWLRRGKVFADWTYRGKPLGLYEFEKEVDHSDWRLVHKCDEDQFKKCDNPFVERRLPSHIPLAPLERFILQESMRKQGKDVRPEDLPMLPLECAVDEEHKMLNSHIKRCPELNPKHDGSIYDVDPKIYLDLYGREMPVKVEKWIV